MTDSYDTLVVGAGYAGAVMAERLLETDVELVAAARPQGLVARVAQDAAAQAPRVLEAVAGAVKQFEDRVRGAGGESSPPPSPGAQPHG